MHIADIMPKSIGRWLKHYGQKGPKFIAEVLWTDG